MNEKDTVKYLRACATNEPSMEDAKRLWNAADTIERLRDELDRQIKATLVAKQNFTDAAAARDELRGKIDE